MTQTQLNKIYKQKNQFIQELSKLSNTYVATIYKGLLNNKGIRQIHKDLYKDTMKNKIYSVDVYRFARNSVKKIKSLLKSVDTKADPILFAIFISGFYEDSRKIIYKNANKLETKLKEDLIQELKKESEIKNISQEENPTIFVISSKHDDCAKDHLQVQGRLFYYKNWKKVVKDKELIKKCEKIIEDRRILCFENVVYRPPYLLTRPNCRHYFNNVSLFEIEQSSTKELIEIFNMHHKVGNILHKNNEHSKNEVLNIISKYKDRLDFDTKLKNVKDSIIINNRIKRDKILIKKWNSYLQTHF